MSDGSTMSSALGPTTNRNCDGTATLALKTPDDLEKANVLIKEHT